MPQGLDDGTPIGGHRRRLRRITSSSRNDDFPQYGTEAGARRLAPSRNERTQRRPPIPGRNLTFTSFRRPTHQPASAGFLLCVECDALLRNIMYCSGLHTIWMALSKRLNTTNGKFADIRHSVDRLLMGGSRLLAFQALVQAGTPDRARPRGAHCLQGGAFPTWQPTRLCDEASPTSACFGKWR